MPSIRILAELEDNFVDAITSERSRRARRRAPSRYVSLGGVIVVLAIALAAVPMLLPDAGDTPGETARSSAFRLEPAAAAVTVVEEGGVRRIEIANLHADGDAIMAALREQGLDVSLTIVPASPSLVGARVATGESAADAGRVTYEYVEGSTAAADVVALNVPLDYRGQLEIGIGRRAHAGEPYATAAVSAAEPGEALHCVDLYGGATVRELLPAIEAAGVRVTWRNPDNREVPVDEVLDLYVNGATPLAAGAVLILTSGVSQS